MIEAQMNKADKVHSGAAGFGFIPLRNLDLFRVSDFEFRISGFQQGAWLLILLIWFFPAAVLLAQTNTNKVSIKVESGGWGDGVPVENIRQLCLSVSGQFWPYFPQEKLPPLVVRHGKSNPITLFQRGKNGEIIIELATSSTFWAQYSYQFAHEFCHVLCHYERTANPRNPNQWFEETLCETASLFALKRMSVAWQTTPPYSNWKSFAPHLAKYAEDTQRGQKRQLPEGVRFGQWFRDNEASLRKEHAQREKNGLMANRLLPLFEATPNAWEAVSWLNQAKNYDQLTFQQYLAGWHSRAPEKYRPFIRQIAAVFELNLRP